jgi:hypothetical protein
MAFLLFLENLMVTKFSRLNLKLKAGCATKENIENCSRF